MANQTVGELNVTMNLELTKLHAQIDTANRRIATMAKRANSDVAKMAKNMNAALATVGVGVSLGGVIAFGKSVLDLGGRITDVAAEAGIGSDALQTLALTAMDSGVTMEQIAQASTKLRVSMQEAAEGNQQLQASFSKLGLDANVLKRLAPERQFELIGQKIASATDKHEAFNAAVEILGAKGAPKLMQFLDQLGTEGFDKLADGLKNVRLTPDQLKTLDDAGDKLGRIWEFTKYLGAKAVVGASNAVSNAHLYSMPEDAASNALASAIHGKDWAARASARNATRGPEAATQAMAALDKEVAAINSANAAQAAYNAKLKEQIDAYNQTSALETARYQRIDALSIAQDGYAEQIDATWRGLSQVKDIGLSLDSSGTFAFDPAKIQSATNAWQQFELQVRQTQDVSDALHTFFDDLDAKSKTTIKGMTDSQKLWAYETQRIAGQAADGMAYAWADAFTGVEGGFSNLGKTIQREIMAMVARMLIVIPIMQAIGTAMQAMGWTNMASGFLSYGGGKAGGGEMKAGTAYQINEGRPELFVPNVSGSMIPVDRMTATSGGSGDSYNFTYNIPAGVSRAELMPILRAQEQHTISAMQDMQRRRKL